jgi:hypothetical protein
MSARFGLWSIFEGEYKAFKVTAPPSASLHNLQQLVKETHQKRALGGIDSCALASTLLAWFARMGVNHTTSQMHVGYLTLQREGWVISNGDEYAMQGVSG